MINNPFIAPKYYVVLRDWNGRKVALFDDWDSLEYTRVVNDVGSHTFVRTGNDFRMNDFALDSILEVHRSVPGVGLGDYVDWVGLHRTPDSETDEQGLTTNTMIGVGLNDLLARPRIGYKGGTIGADKADVAETVMKQYVVENCGYAATMANGREVDNVLPGFEVDTDLRQGVVWTGSESAQVLLDTLKKISQYAHIDYAVNYTGGEFGPVGFLFQTYMGQLGNDRTDIGLDTVTGLNAAGFAPVIFSIEQGNVAKAKYVYERTQESNVIYVLGDGQGSTQHITVRVDATALDSPWNHHETSRPYSGYQYQREAFGDATLQQLRAMEQYDFTPRSLRSCVYGLHYNLGDMVVAIQGGVKRYKRLTSIKVKINGPDNRESLEFKFADIPYAR